MNSDKGCSAQGVLADEDFYDQLCYKWFGVGMPKKDKMEPKHDNAAVSYTIDVDDDNELWNGLTKQETDASMSVKGLSQQPPRSVDNLSEHWSKISPQHYKDVVPGYEYMDIMEHVLGYDGTVSHLRGQLFKYLFRFGKKDATRVEAGKIAWYANRLEDVIERQKKGLFPCVIRR